MTVASESYPSELLSVNAFRARGAVFGGKLLSRSVALSVVASNPAQHHRTTRCFSHRRHRSWPTVGAFTSGVLTARHYLRGDGERLPMNFVTKDGESAARVKVGSKQLKSECLPPQPGTWPCHGIRPTQPRDDPARSEVVQEFVSQSRISAADYLSLRDATSTGKLLAFTEVTRSQPEFVRSFRIRNEAGGSLCDLVCTSMVWR